uniref:WW domain-containing protein n=1 Tax=Leersia perrieri TaxID=77586 RepID=A0A0D9WV08_9ORYZ
MAAEMVNSAVIGETANRIISSLISKLKERPDELRKDNIERMEMAHIRMEAALVMSSKWQITDVPVLQWRSKLKRAAQDCDDALRRSKQRIVEDNQTRRRRFADGANDFVKLVEFGGTPRQYMFYDPLIGNLLSGKYLRYTALKGSIFYYLTIRPMSFEERGVEASAGFIYQDSKEPSKDIRLGFMLRLSESTDVFGVIIRCLQSCMPHYKFVAEHLRRELIQLPTQDFSWMTHSSYSIREYWINVHNTLTQWYRPNPFCCSDHGHHRISSPSTISNTKESSPSLSSRRTRLSSMFPEQVIAFHLQCHISLSDIQHNSDAPPLKLGALFIPHDTQEDMLEPQVESYALESIDENDQEMIHTSACLQDIDEKLLPKALQHLYKNNVSRMYQMCFKSSHGTAHFCVEKVRTATQSARRKRSTTRSLSHDNKRIRGDNYDNKGWKTNCIDLLKFQCVRASKKLQEMVNSAVIGETANRIISSLISKLKERPDELRKDNIERMEMAHIRMEAALVMSSKWQITDVPVLRWRSKLKRAAQDCDDALRRSKQRIVEDNQTRQQVSQSFPKRVAHATKSLVSSFISRDDASCVTSADVQRFERLADGANDFLKLVEFGGTPRQYMFFNPLIGNLFSGKYSRYIALKGSTFYYLVIRPVSFEERGVEATVGFVYQDSKDPSKDIRLGFMLRLSESTDVFGVIIKSLQSCMPHYKFVAEHVRRELVQLPTQDFSWKTHPSYSQREYWINVHNTLTKWYRLNAFCCSDLGNHLITSPSTISNTPESSPCSSSRRRRLSTMFPEQVIAFLLECRVTLSDVQHNSNMPPLKLGALFIPHDSPDDMLEPAVESYAVESFGENDQELVHTNTCLQDIDEKLLPKALHYLYKNDVSRMYQMCFKSSHGTAHLCVEKMCTGTQSARRKRSTTRSPTRDNKRMQGDNYDNEGWKTTCIELLKFQAVRGSNKLQGSIRSWMKHMVSSAVIGETANRIISSLVRKIKERPDKLSDNIERMEMAHIRLEAALVMSSKWQITDVPVLRWRRKLKRAAQDCDDTLRRSKQRVMEDNQTRQRVSHSFPKRIAHVTKSLVSSFISGDDTSCVSSTDVQRFERLADGANDFVKMVEFGGTPRKYMFFNPLIGNLLSGKCLRYMALKGSTFYYLLVRPVSLEERGMEATIGFIYQDLKDPSKDIRLGFMLRLSESTDVFGVIIKCIQTCMPRYKFVAECVRRELIQLPTQDFSWGIHPSYSQREYWINVHSTLTSQWYRPNPYCCSDHTNKSSPSPSSSRRTFSSMFPEQVIALLLQCHISLSDTQHSLDMPPLKLGALFIPHDTPEDMLEPESIVESYALDSIGENKQKLVQTNASLQDIDEKLLPKALQYLYKNNGSRMYQMCFKSSHGIAHLCVEKVPTETHSARIERSTTRSLAHDNNRIVEQGDSFDNEGWKATCIDLLKFQAVRTSNKLQGLIRSWITLTMAAEKVGSAVIGETMNRIISSLVSKLKERPDELSKDNIERMEMAHIRMEAALVMSSKWQITDVPVLRWRSKLKRAAQDCDDTLRRSKQRIVEDNQTKQQVSHSFPKMIAHATKSLVSSFITGDDASCVASADVQRFERLADGAIDFLKLVEFGGTPRQYMFFNPLIGNLLSGKCLRYRARKGSTFYSLAIRPISFEDRGVEATVGFIYHDTKEPSKDVELGFMFRLSESTDIFGIIIKCLQYCMPHCKFASEFVSRELIQLPTQDFSWETYPSYSHHEYWMNVHGTLTQWYRPNPFCCSDHDYHRITPSTSSNINNASPSPSSSRRRLSSMFPEQVMVLFLQCHISLSDIQHNLDMPPLKLCTLVMPHNSQEDILEPKVESYSLESIGENEQELVHTDACLQDIDENLLPEALQYLYNNNGSRMYEMCFKSNHGSAHLCVEKVSTEPQSALRTRSATWSWAHDDKRKIEQVNNERWVSMCTSLLKFRVARASEKLQGSIRSWVTQVTHKMEAAAAWKLGSAAMEMRMRNHENQRSTPLPSRGTRIRKSTAEEHLERLEMAHIKLEAVLETSYKWRITDPSLLRWQKKLKCAAQECDDTLHECRQRALEEEETEQEVRNSSFPKRIAHATKSLISSIFFSNINDSSRFAVQRFEWFADGAKEFLRFVEFGGTTHQYLFFDPLIRQLLAGKTLEYKLLSENKYRLFVIRPFNVSELRMEARLIFDSKNPGAPEDDFFLCMLLQISESMDIFGIVIKCLQLFNPHVKSTAESVRNELTQLPSQDFSWVPYAESSHQKHWDNIHNITTQWFRPNPLCCKQHTQSNSCGRNNIGMSTLQGVSLGPVIEVSLQCQVPIPEFREKGTIVEGKPCLEEFPHLKVDLVYTPHGSSEDLFPSIDSSVIEMINGDKQHCLHTNIALEQLEEIMLPRAVDCFRENAKAALYQMLWKSKHGGAYLQVVKATSNIQSTRRTIRRARKAKVLQRHGHKSQHHTDAIADFPNLWVAHAPVQLQGSILDWIQKEKETQLAPPLLRLKF